MSSEVDVHYLRKCDETESSCGPVAFYVVRGGNDPQHPLPAEHSDQVASDFSNSTVSSIDTHWSRILYYDLFNVDTCGSNPYPREITKGDLPPPSYELHHAARVHRSLSLRKTIIALIHAAGAIARRAHARYRQCRQASATYDSLRHLDDRTLRDLGFDRSELMSVAAEVTREAENTRVHALTDAAQSSERSAVRRRLTL